jgi:lambda repressor-like predicted transcriptional regulator
MLTKSSTELIRQQNRARILAALRRKNGQSHTELAIETGLASATVTAITQELENENVIERTVAAPPADAAGRESFSNSAARRPMPPLSGYRPMCCNIPWSTIQVP